MYPINMFCCIKTSFVGSKIARLCKHDECEHKKGLNFYTQYKTSSAFCDFIPKCRNWRIVDAFKDKKQQKRKIKIKTTKANRKQQQQNIK